MAGDPGLDFNFHLSGGTGNLFADLSLGGIQSNFQINRLTTTITAVAAAGATRIFMGNIGTPKDVIVIRDGASGGFVTPIIDSDSGGGWTDLLDPLPSSAAIGDSVFFCKHNHQKNPFQDTTALESADGTTQYFGGYIAVGAGTHNGVGIHLEEYNPGTVVHEIAVSSDPLHVLATIPDLFTAPDLAGMMVGGNRGSFVRPLTKTLKTPVFNVTGPANFGFWLKRTTLPNQRAQTNHAVRLVVTDDATLEAKIALTWDTIGFTPQLAVTSAPSIYTGGGARFRANVKSVENGLVVPGIPVTMRLASGTGTFTPPAAPAETDEKGNVVGHYTATTNPGDVGTTVNVEAEV